MAIETSPTHGFRSTTFPRAPWRKEECEAKGDDARGREFIAFSRLLATITDEQWEKVTAAWLGETSYADEGVALDKAIESRRARGLMAVDTMIRNLSSTYGPGEMALRNASHGVLMKDRIPRGVFASLTGPVTSGAGIDFDALGESAV